MPLVFVGAGSPLRKPRSKARNAGSGDHRAACSWVTFFWPNKRKSLALRCENRFNNHSRQRHNTQDNDTNHPQSYIGCKSPTQFFKDPKFEAFAHEAAQKHQTRFTSMDDKILYVKGMTTRKIVAIIEEAKAYNRHIETTFFIIVALRNLCGN